MRGYRLCAHVTTSLGRRARLDLGFGGEPVPALVAGRAAALLSAVVRRFGAFLAICFRRIELLRWCLLHGFECHGVSWKPLHHATRGPAAKSVRLLPARPVFHYSGAPIVIGDRSRTRQIRGLQIR